MEVKITKRTLKNKITTVSLVLFGILLFFSTWVSKELIENKMTDVFLEKGVEQVQEIAYQAEYILKSDENDIENLQKFVEKKALQNNIAYAIIIDTNVTAIAHSDKQKIGKVYEDEYSIDGSKNGNIKTSKFYADVQKIWTYDIMVPIYKNGELVGVVDIGLPESGIKKIIDSFLITQIITTISSFVLIGILMIIVFGKVFKPLDKLVNLINRTSEFDLENDDTYKKLTNNNDEIGRITISILEMRSKIADIVGSIKTSSYTINEASQHLSKISQDTLSSNNEISITIEEISKATEAQAIDTESSLIKITELSSEIDKILNISNDIASMIIETDTLSDKGSENIKNLIESTIKNKEISNKVKNIVVDMDQNSAQITGIVDTITSIASQTNLLALNASIESARAGEAGKGFAVVADEIRKLAEQTAKSTEEIKNQISSIKEKSSLAVSEIESNVVIVEQNNDNVNKTEEAFSQISKALNELKYKTDDVLDFSKSIKNNKDDVVESIQNISAVSEETSASTEQIAAALEESVNNIEGLSNRATDLNGLSDLLQSEIDKFKL
ncbi:methyl-accepting chemotaxis protein [Tepidibacter hydrothermalis]|uniref:Methyl-accepting chemotaxis protein n=1 Tax=Tepidibacter hydrothermalis TaxID=3036126 RepID=A0ABY8EDT3_9FIRM|nr:methyl-accepting chemotaxis protein [Tepidibacter hydrothermalis]WFD09944.1 methyl-accepting chemotaxis protein [Tepidibacter hydrothermalis]